MPLNEKNIFQSRSDEKYLNYLLSKLQIEKLAKSAINVTEKSGQYDKIIRIDFCGIAGTTLLLNDWHDELKLKVSEAFTNIFQNLDYFEENRIKVKTRFLFMYLYSDFSFAQIEAERTPFRATVSEPKLNTRTSRLYSLKDADFVRSSNYNDQVTALNKLERIHNDFYSERKATDILNIRFCCLPLNFCLLTINSDTFIDTYTYAKQYPDSKNLAYQTPLVYVNEKENEANFKFFEDHFRYLWTHPTTLFYEDATKADLDKENNYFLQNLSEINSPQEVEFTKKFESIKERYPNIKDDELGRLKFKVSRMFSSMTRRIQKTPDGETIFIAYSFAKGIDYAEKTKKFLTEDFPHSLNVNIVDLSKQYSKTLHHELIEKMDEASIGLMFFTKDIEEAKSEKSNFYSKPNVSFEFGYIMKQVANYNPSPLTRLIIMYEKDLIIPSDIQDLYREQITWNIYLDYKYIIIRIFEINLTLTKSYAEQAMECYLKRLSYAFNEGLISQKDIGNKSFAQFYADIKNELSSIIHERFRSKRR